MAPIREATPADRDAVVALWRAAGLLSNPLNEPVRDFDFALASDNATILVSDAAGAVAASVMVGHDGHRGWVYYLASDPERRGSGLGRRVLLAAERWVAARGLPKLQLMVRASNTRVIGFYQRLGYVVEPREVIAKRLDGQAVQLGGQPGTEPVTVTFLEMTTRPTRPRIEPAGARKLALLRAAPPTLSFYRYLYDAIGRDWYWTDRKLLGDEALLAIIRDEKVELFVLYADGSPAGAFELDRRRDGVVDLAYFGIMPEFIGQRFGPYLLGEAIDAAWRHQPRKLTVNTCTLDHPKALPLYQRYGFEVVARQTASPPWLRGEAESDD